MTGSEWLFLVGFLAGLTIVLYLFGMVILMTRK